MIKAAHEKFDTDESPIYGLYYFARGGKIDQGKLEAVDKNDYYATG